MVIEQALVPAFRGTDHAPAMQQTMSLVAMQLATAVARLQDVGSLSAFEDLKTSIPILFAVEELLIRNVPSEAVIDLEFAQRLDDEFASLMGRSDLQEIRVLLGKV